MHASPLLQSDRARLVDMWVESCCLIGRDGRLARQHFDRETRQSLKKMRPAAAQQVEITHATEGMHVEAKRMPRACVLADGGRRMSGRVCDAGVVLVLVVVCACARVYLCLCVRVCF